MHGNGRISVDRLVDNEEYNVCQKGTKAVLTLVDKGYSSAPTPATTF